MMHLKMSIGWLAAACIVAVGCKRVATPVAGPAPASVTVAAASSVKPAMEALAAEYQAAHPEVRIHATFGASGSLLAQIANGGPFDLFYSADREYPKELVSKGLTRGAERVYATGTLVLWTRRDSGIGVAGKGAAVLGEAAVRHVAIANPETAPYGRAAKAALESLGLASAVSEKLVTGENVEQTAQFAQTGAAEAAFVPLSLALSPAMKELGVFWTVPGSAYPAIEQAVVVTSKAGKPAEEFEAFVAGPRGRDVLASFGFGPAVE